MYLDPLIVASNVCFVYWKKLIDFFALAKRCGFPTGSSLYAKIICFASGIVLSRFTIS